MNHHNKEKMDKAIQMTGAGGVDMLELAQVPAASPGPRMVRVRHEAIGVNFIDIYHRTGLYPLPFPAVPGVEAAGVIEVVGEGVTGLAVGDRVAYAGAPVGAYATARNIPVNRLVKLPDNIVSKQAAASMLKGLTAHILLTRTYAVNNETTLLIHAAAGGLGGLLVKWAKHLGATVIGTAGSPSKAELARSYGADHVIIGRDADIVAEVMALTDGQGADYTIDGIGGAMLLKSLACTRRFGTVASIGQAAGTIPPVSVDEIGPIRSLSLARPSVMGYVADNATYHQAAASLLDMMAAGVLAGIGGEYPLEDAAKAQADLEAGRTTGSLLLIPQG